MKHEKIKNKMNKENNKYETEWIIVSIEDKVVVIDLNWPSCYINIIFTSLCLHVHLMTSGLHQSESRASWQVSRWWAGPAAARLLAADRARARIRWSVRVRPEETHSMKQQQKKTFILFFVGSLTAGSEAERSHSVEILREPDSSGPCRNLD